MAPGSLIYLDLVDLPAIGRALHWQTGRANVGAMSHPHIYDHICVLHPLQTKPWGFCLMLSYHINSYHIYPWAAHRRDRLSSRTAPTLPEPSGVDAVSAVLVVQP